MRQVNRPVDLSRGLKALIASALFLSVVAPSGVVARTQDGAASSRRISEVGGLGRIETSGSTGAVLQRDEGIVTLLDLKGDGAPKPLGSYDDDAKDSLDGDLAFSDDGKWLFYARQTVQFSKDGLHVLNVSDPKAPTLASYAPGGGAYRVEYYRDDGGAWVVLLDATAGLVIYRFDPTTGTLVQVFTDALPQLKVGGPASAGIYIDRKDAATGAPLMYITTGKTGLQVYDLTDPMDPPIVGAWSEVGLAEVEVVDSASKRTVFAATEYWFDKSIVPEVIALDATKLDSIAEKKRFATGIPDEFQRLQGMAVSGGRLYVAASARGLLTFRLNGRAAGTWVKKGTPNPEAGVAGSPYVMDVEVKRGRILVTDAATGVLTSLPVRR